MNKKIKRNLCKLPLFEQTFDLNYKFPHRKNMHNMHPHKCINMQER